MNAYTLALLPPVLLAIAEPVLFVPLCLAALLIAVTLAGLRFRGQRDEAREAAERAGRERDAAETEARIATDLLAQREADARRQELRVVQAPIPMQRRGEEWDEIVRAVEGEQS